MDGSEAVEYRRPIGRPIGYKPDKRWMMCEELGRKERECRLT